MPCQWQFCNAIGNSGFWEISSISIVLATMSFVIVTGINTRVLRRPAMEMRARIKRVHNSAENCLISAGAGNRLQPTHPVGPVYLMSIPRSFAVPSCERTFSAPSRPSIVDHKFKAVSSDLMAY
jgi:hypothetical protein